MKSIGIEDLLKWAFVYELPKGGGEGGLASPNSAWGRLSGFAELMTVIDTGQGGGTWFEQGDPHPDAEAVAHAVRALEPPELDPATDYVADWPDPHGLLPEAVAAALERYTLKSHEQRRRHVVQLVISSAILGRGPDWRAKAPKQAMVMKRGKPAWFVKKRVRDSFGRSYQVEVDGYDRKAQRPRRGAYRNYELTTDPVADVLSRLDWNIWVGCLEVLQTELDGRLGAYRVMPTEKQQNPWCLPLPECTRNLAAVQTLRGHKTETVKVR